MNFENDIYKYLGIFVVSIMAVVVISRFLKFQGKIVEGLVPNQDGSEGTGSQAASNAEDLKTSNARQDDVLNVSKNRAGYEDVIIESENVVNAGILQWILGPGVQILKGDVTSESSQKSIEVFRNLVDYKKGLGEAMSILQEMK